MPKFDLNQSDLKTLCYLLDGQGQVSLTHDRPPNGAWFVEVTDTWTNMVTKLFSSSSLSAALMKATEKKADILKVDLDDILDPLIEETEEEEEDG